MGGVVMTSTLISAHWPVRLQGCPKCSGDLHEDSYGDWVCHQCGWDGPTRSGSVVQSRGRNIQDPAKGLLRLCSKCEELHPCDENHFSLRRDGYWDSVCRACRRAPKDRVRVACPSCGEEREVDDNPKRYLTSCRKCQVAAAQAAGFGIRSAKAIALYREGRG
jgi:hypothetical protein